MKCDKARREWLTGLVDGAAVAVVRDDGVVESIGKILLLHDCFRVVGKVFTIKTGKSIGTVNSYVRWIVPLTPQIQASWELEKRRAEAASKLSCFRGWYELPAEKVLAVAAILWPDVPE